MRLFVIAFLFCQQILAQLPDGNWHAALKINDTLELPFTFTTSDKKIIIHNAEENIQVDEISQLAQYLFIQMPVFDSEFRCRLSGDTLEGDFINHARTSKNIFSFRATRGMSYRFSDKPERSKQNISGRYRVKFDGEDDESKIAVGIFNQVGGRLTATFLTTTGDYRFLEGEVNGNRIWLSAFDGSHLFLFTAIIKNDSLVNGEFFSGQHWHDTWSAKKDEQVVLPSPDSLTWINPGFEKFNFTFPDENGKMYSLSDDRFQNKPVIIQIMGTWCPNCLDETKFLSEWYKKNKHRNIEIVALDYERIAENETANKNISRLKSRFDITYPILFAGSSDKTAAAKTLPMLSRVFAFPTTIFLNKDKKVIKIHTGFNGPATGVEYQKFVSWFDEMVEKLEH